MGPLVDDPPTMMSTHNAGSLGPLLVRYYVFGTVSDSRQMHHAKIKQFEQLGLVL